MNKTAFNFIIDALMFLSMMAIAGIGFLMKFILLPGRESHITYGRNVDLFLFGIDRHEWGTIHLILGFILLGLLILHIVLHWNMILGIYHKMIENQKMRRVIFWISIIGSAILILFPFFVKPEVQERGRREGGYGRGKGYFEKGQEMMKNQPYKNYER